MTHIIRYTQNGPSEKKKYSKSKNVPSPKIVQSPPKGSKSKMFYSIAIQKQILIHIHDLKLAARWYILLLFASVLPILLIFGLRHSSLSYTFYLPECTFSKKKPYFFFVRSHSFPSIAFGRKDQRYYYKYYKFGY